jgi:hypothetical protein
MKSPSRSPTKRSPGGTAPRLHCLAPYVKVPPTQPTRDPAPGEKRLDAVFLRIVNSAWDNPPLSHILPRAYCQAIKVDY